MRRRLGGWNSISIVLLCLILSACTPPEQGRVVRDVAVSANGSLVEIDSGDYQITEAPETVTGPLAEVGTATEACLDSGLCFRIGDRRRITQSNDGWETSEVVWEISPEASWWGHEYDDGWNAPVIGLFDIVVLPDETVAVASGQLPVIRRSIEGEWTPLVASMRTLPAQSIWLLPVGVAMILAGAFAFGRQHGTRAARLALVCLGPCLVTFVALYLGASKSIGVVLSGVFTVPLALLGVGLLIGAVFRSRHTSRHLRAVAPVIGATVATALSIWCVTYALWTADRMPWRQANVIWLLTLVVALGVVASWSATRRPTEPVKPPEIEKSTTLVGTLVLGLVAVVGAIILGTVAGAFVTRFLPVGEDAVAAAFLLLFVGCAIGFIAGQVEKLPYG